MRKILLFAIASCFYCSIQAQLFRTGEAEFNGIVYPAYIKEVEVSPNDAMDAIKEILANRNAGNPKNIKGWMVYRNVVLPSTGTYTPQDLFAKVERAGKKQEDKSRISLIITKPGVISDQKPPKGTKSVPVGFTLATGGSAIFEEATPAIENKAYLQAVLNQEKAVQKAEKKLSDLKLEEERLTKYMEKLQSDIENNKKDIESQIQAIENAKSDLQKVKEAKPARN
jgi:DNA-binding FrmR family transcriptional regulator